MGMRGLTAYAETVSVYGTEPGLRRRRRHAVVEVVPGFRLRLTRPQDAVHVGHGVRGADGLRRGQVHALPRDPLRHVTKGAGVQGLQNGSISCIGVPGAVPSGIRAVLAENMATVLMDLEVASGNDQTFTHSPIRNTARMLMQFLPGTDFIFSGYCGAELRQHVRRLNP